LLNAAMNALVGFQSMLLPDHIIQISPALKHFAFDLNRKGIPKARFV
jgi:hypothetical protein